MTADNLTHPTVTGVEKITVRMTSAQQAVESTSIARKEDTLFPCAEKGLVKKQLELAKL